MKLVDINALRAQWTQEQYEGALYLTKKKMNTYKLLALIFLLLGGIGLFLPFGKQAQLYSIGYANLRGRSTNATLWAFTGFIMSLLMGFLGKVFPSLITPKFIYPAD